MIMELIERYLQAVGFWLPKKQKADIIAELSGDIYAETEEREGELGRKLNDTEVEDLLKKRGSPMLVANRFLPQHSLIGPLLYPLYIFVLKVVSLCYLVPWLLINLSLMIVNPAYPAGQPRPSWLAVIASASGHFWTAAIITLGTTTLAFAILERLQAGSCFFEKWNPRSLPPLRNQNAIPRVGSAIELAVNLLFIVWWVTYMHSTAISIGSTLRFSLSPQWAWFFWSYLAVAFFNVATAAMKLMRPWWTTSRATLHLVGTLLGSVLFCLLLKANILAGIATPNLSPQKAMDYTQAFNHWANTFFPVGVLVVLVIAASDIYRIIRVKSA
jgi:hypothetical protein